MAAMRVLVISAVIAITACSPQMGGQSPGTASPTSTACSLPVWWGGKGSDVHAGFVSVPDGTFKDAGVLPYTNPSQTTLGGGYGGTYDPVKGVWIRAARPAVSPDGSRYAYWTAGASHGEIHVVDAATGADHIAYSGTIPFILVGFESDAIYLAHIINARQGAFELLYRLDPSRGSPSLVPGSDRHMDQYGWVLVDDGAAWGIDNRLVGNDYVYSLLRLDLTTSQVMQWDEGSGDKVGWPLGVDRTHRLYAASGNGPVRIDAPGHVIQLPNSPDVYVSNAIGGPSGFVADSNGVWFSGVGSVWFYSDGKAPKRFTVGLANQDVYPAGTCLS